MDSSDASERCCADRFREDWRRLCNRDEGFKVEVLTGRRSVRPLRTHTSKNLGPPPHPLLPRRDEAEREAEAEAEAEAVPFRPPRSQQASSASSSASANRHRLRRKLPPVKSNPASENSSVHINDRRGAVAGGVLLRWRIAAMKSTGEWELFLCTTSNTTMEGVTDVQRFLGA